MPGTSILPVGPLSAGSHLGSFAWEYVAFTIPRYASTDDGDLVFGDWTLTSAVENCTSASEAVVRVPFTAKSFTSLNEAVGSAEAAADSAGGVASVVATRRSAASATFAGAGTSAAAVLGGTPTPAAVAGWGSIAASDGGVVSASADVDV